jgi:hypothetical protein
MSFATVAIDTFITELSSVLRNCAEANVISTLRAAFAVRSGAVDAVTRSPFLRPDYRRQGGSLQGPKVTPGGRESHEADPAKTFWADILTASVKVGKANAFRPAAPGLAVSTTWTVSAEYSPRHMGAEYGVGVAVGG